MPQLIGEYDCKIDAKGRMRMPSQLLKQLGGDAVHQFVLNRGFEKCLMIYPKANWAKITKEIDNLNVYDPKQRQFIRYFYRGASEVATDSSERILFPKRLMQYANLTKEVVLFAYNDRIEVWDKEAYDNMLDEEPEDFSALAHEVMVKKDKEEIVEVNVKTMPGGAGWTSDQ
ncbi:MAG: division/cell wall cluster transcriptional repressor MraZ [Bacteroidota bacterium]